MNPLRQIVVAERDPRAVFILVLCVISGVPLIFNKIEPNSVEALLPTWGVIAWGFALVLGAMITLTGMALQKRYKNGLLIEQFGNAAVGAASLIYALALLISNWPDGALVSGIVAGWGASCLYRWWQIQKAINGLEVPR